MCWVLESWELFSDYFFSRKSSKIIGLLKANAFSTQVRSPTFSSSLISLKIWYFFEASEMHFNFWISNNSKCMRTMVHVWHESIKNHIPCTEFDLCRIILSKSEMTNSGLHQEIGSYPNSASSLHIIFPAIAIFVLRLDFHKENVELPMGGPWTWESRIDYSVG